MEHIVGQLLAPASLFGAADILARPSAAPAAPGIYAWYFGAIPGDIDVSGCHRRAGLYLLYAGISPKPPPLNGRPTSRSNLRQRLRTHYGGNAAGSTLRLTLGCLLADELGIELRRVGSGERLTFTNPGEQRLDRWMAAHALVTWTVCPEPWLAEAALLGGAPSLPLNISGNPHLRHGEQLSARRGEARLRARALAIVTDSGGPRRDTQDRVSERRSS